MEKTKQKPQATMQEKLNTLRAGVLGANDGILTVVGVLVSVAAATTDQFTIFIAGLADLLACAFSMSAGEYASVSAQKDTEKAAVAQEEYLLKHDFNAELAAVRDHYLEKGLSEQTATAIAKDLLNKKPLATVVRVKYDIELGHYLNPWHAAYSSLFAAALGGLLPLLAMVAAPVAWRWEAVILSVILTSTLTAYISSKLGNGLVKIAIFRNILVGIITVIIHYGVGKLF